MFSWIRNPKFVALTPIFSVAMLEIANVQQLIQMWTTKTADGQSLGGWCCVAVALLLWLNFYLTFNKAQKWAIYGTILGIVMNASVIASVIKFRYF